MHDQRVSRGITVLVVMDTMKRQFRQFSTSSSDKERFGVIDSGKMNRAILSSILFISCLMIPIDTPAEPEGSLTADFVKKLRDGYEMNSEDRARFNAISNTDIDTLALNRQIVNGEHE